MKIAPAVLTLKLTHLDQTTQDFYGDIELGSDNKSTATVDTDSVLITIKSLKADYK